jgi:CIC family chloride channel protein
MISWRIPSGRASVEQPNVTGHGDAPLTAVFWLAVVATGVATGLLGALMMVVLFGVEHLTFGFHTGSFQAAVERASALRRVVALAVAGAVGGVAWFLLRRATPGEPSEIDDAIWNGTGRLSFRRSFGSSVISEFVIGMGASIGRESAPKLMGGASGSVLAGWTRLNPAQRRLLVACGGGAGLACVYNVPLGGALFTAEVLIGTLALPVVLPALVCAWVATITAWVYLPTHATYLDVPKYHFSAPLMVFAVLVGPVLGVGAVVYIRLVAWISHHRVSGRWALGAPLVAFTLLGLIGIAFPQLFGNGKDMAHEVFLGGGTLGLLLALSALKPLVTSLCLGSGASGGLFTPVLSTGAVLGAGLGIAWSGLWPGSATGAYALVGAAGMIGAGMQAPLAALALVAELTHGGFSIMVPMMAATAIATVVSHHLDGYSIYTSRLASRPRPAAPSDGGQGSTGVARLRESADSSTADGPASPRQPPRLG